MVFASSTEKIPVVVEELNQRAKKKLFGLHGQELIDRKLYAKLHPSLDRTGNTIRIKFGTYNKAVQLHVSQATACDSLIYCVNNNRQNLNTHCPYLRITTDETFIKYGTG